MDYQVYRLPNGIRLLHKPFSSSISHACILINAGSRDEPEGKDGLAHFIEHLLFKRTQKRTTNQILNRLEAVGGDLNAYTTKEYTCIHASFLNPHLERTLELFEDLVFHSVFPEEELKKEKSVILDEIASYEDQPEEAIYDDFENLIFKNDALGRNILGTEESVSALSKADIRNFLKQHYNTSEIILGVIGNYEEKALNRIFKKLFSEIPENNNSRERSSPVPYLPETQKINKQISQSHCVIGGRAYSIHHPDKTALLLLNNILGGTGMSSRLNLQIREKYGIAYTIESGYTPLSDTGVFSIYFGTDAEKTSKALKLIHKELKNLRENKLGAMQLHQAKKKFIGQIALGEENRMGMIISMCKSLLDYGRADTLEEIFEKINAVTAEQLLKAANETFSPEQLSMLLFEPLD